MKSDMMQKWALAVLAVVLIVGTGAVNQESIGGRHMSAEAKRENMGHRIESVAKKSMESAAAEMLAEEEQNEDMLHREALSQEHGEHDLGESSALDDDDPTPPWVDEERERQKQEETRNEEAKIESAMRSYDGKKRYAKNHFARKREYDLVVQDGEAAHVDHSDSMHGDLGESDDVAVQVHSSDSNSLTSAAQAAARTQTKLHQKAAAFQRAKKIADKVRNLVRDQQQLEKKSGHKVVGSILGKAQQEQNRAAEMSSQDELLAQKMEDQQAQATMQHLIQTERHEQRKAFEQERETTHNLLHSVRQKLSLEQHNLVKHVRTEADSAVKKVEKELSETSLAKTIEDVVKQKLAKRLSELKNAGEKTVHDVSTQLRDLKHRVRRLRREQTRMKMAESGMQQNLMHQSQTRDLGESASVGGGSMTAELEKLRLEQMMTQIRPPPSRDSEEHLEFLRMKDEMGEMRKQNRFLQQLVAKSVHEEKTPYTQGSLHKYFQGRSRRNIRRNEFFKKHMVTKQHQNRQIGNTNDDEADGFEPQMLLQLSEGSEDAESTSGLALFNQRAEQARVDVEHLQQQALTNELQLQKFGE